MENLIQKLISLFECKTCCSTKKVDSMGGMQKACPNCSNWYFKVIYWFKNNKGRLKGVGFIKNFPLQAACIVSAILILSAFFVDDISAVLILVLSCIGLVFSALKYTLDQANYHKGLFDPRYAIFSEINDIQYQFTQLSLNEATKHRIQELRCRCDKQMQKAYYLFGEETFEFVEKFRRAIIDLEVARCGKYDPAAKEVMDAELFLMSLSDYKNLLNYFRELKINFY